MGRAGWQGARRSGVGASGVWGARAGAQQRRRGKREKEVGYREKERKRQMENGKWKKKRKGGEREREKGEGGGGIRAAITAPGQPRASCGSRVNREKAGGWKSDSWNMKRFREKGFGV